MPDQETVDYIAITRVQSAYADIVNRRAWAELHELFRPGARVEIDTVTNPLIELEGADALGSFIGGAIERFEFFEFVILNARVSIDADRASARIYMQELRQEAGTGAWSTAYGLYRDEYVRADGRWWIAGRRYRSLARTGPATAVFPPPLD